MGIMESLFGGSVVKTKPSDPTLESWQNQMFNYKPGLGKAGQYYKQILKKLGSGDDVSSYGQFNTLRQRQAADTAGVDTDYGSGANALIAGTGGEQAGLMQGLKDRRVADIGKNYAQAYAGATSDLSREAASGFQNAYDAKRQAGLSAWLAALGSRGSYYGNRYQMGQTGGIIPALSGMASSAMKMYGGGGG